MPTNIQLSGINRVMRTEPDKNNVSGRSVVYLPPDHGADLPFPRKPGIDHLVLHKLTRDTRFEQWVIPAGTEVKLITTTNFGVVMLKPGTKDITGYKMHRVIFNY